MPSGPSITYPQEQSSKRYLHHRQDVAYAIDANYAKGTNTLEKKVDAL